MKWRLSASSLVSIALGCSAPPSASSARPPTPATAASAPSAPVTTPAQSAAPQGEAPPPAQLEAAPARALLALTRVIEAPVHELALGKSTKVVALGAEAWLGGDGPFTKLAPLALPSEHLRVFFGRDDRPRVMGHVAGAAGDEPVYLRWRDAAWKKAPGELGRLASGGGVLYGVLGHDDPEVVCKDSDACIVKRLTGWTTIGLPPAIARIELCGPLAWARAGKQIWRLAGESWLPVAQGAAFARADGLWAISEVEVWVAERGADALHRFDGKTWSSAPSPIEGPTALWASAASDVWLAGDGGAAHFDGSSWTRVEGAPRGLSLVAGRAELVWLGGTPGLFRGVRAQ